MQCKVTLMSFYYIVLEQKVLYFLSLGGGSPPAPPTERGVFVQVLHTFDKIIQVGVVEAQNTFGAQGTQFFFKAS
jgi:hypothetical protein